MKKFTASALIITVILTLAACGSKPIKYKNDVSLSAVAEAVTAALPNATEMVEVPETYVSAIMDIDTSNFTEFKVFKQVTGTVIDEYGIFKVTDSGYIDTAIAALNGYIEVTKNSSMISEYMAEEMPKLDAAEVKSMGEYVIFCILSEEAKTDLFAAVSDILTEK